MGPWIPAQSELLVNPGVSWGVPGPDQVTQNVESSHIVIPSPDVLAVGFNQIQVRPRFTSCRFSPFSILNGERTEFGRGRGNNP
jgi:hypothetical protein